MKSLRTSSTRKNKKMWRLFAALSLAAALAAVLSLALGPVSVAPWDVVAALFGGNDGSAEARIVLYARLPRICGCILAGADSATVSATFGVIRRSTTGSFARFRNIATWSATPLSSNVLRKKSATSCFTPIAANTMANCSSEFSPSEACFTICAAS